MTTTRPGIKTSEFAIMVVGVILSILAGFGLLNDEQSFKLSELIVPVIIAVLPATLYVGSRANAKMYVNSIKAGVRTSEFWVSVIALVLGIAVMIGSITQSEANEWYDMLVPLLFAVPSYKYAQSRGVIKRESQWLGEKLPALALNIEEEE